MIAAVVAFVIIVVVVVGGFGCGLLAFDVLEGLFEDRGVLGVQRELALRAAIKSFCHLTYSRSRARCSRSRCRSGRA